VPPRRRSASPSPQEGRTVRLSPTDVDPLASLGVSRIAVDIGGDRWIIPALDAAEWLKVLLDDDLDPELIFPGFCGPDVIVEVNRKLIDGTITMAQMEQALYDVLEAASGRRWWITLRLARTVRTHWDRVGGELASHGVTPFGVSLSYWLDGAYATFLRLLKDADPQAMGDFTKKLTAPPPGMALAVFDHERAAESWRAAYNSRRR
jgi:hypothetical protein